MKKLEEMDLLKLKALDQKAENLMMMIEMARLKAQEAKAQIEKLNPKRQSLYQEIKTKYDIPDQFTYDRDTGEITENTPEPL